ncbi:MAG: hypothetical protein V7603_640 [Micromonosporaceae bacterium]
MRWVGSQVSVLFAPAARALRARRWRDLWLGPAAALLVAVLALAFRTRPGHAFLAAYAITRPGDGLAATLLKLPLSMFAPAALLPFWFALIQVSLVYSLAQTLVGARRTIVVAVCGHTAATLCDHLWIMLGRPLGVNHSYDTFGDAGPSVAVVTLLVYIAVVHRIVALAIAILGYDAIELAVFNGLSQRDHLVGVLTGVTAAVATRWRGRRRDRNSATRRKSARTRRLYEDPPGLVSAMYLPGGDLAATLRGARGWVGKARAGVSLAVRLRLAPLYVLTVVTLGLVLEHGVSPALHDRLLLANSTNVVNLEHGRIWTLVTSVLLVDEQIHVAAVVQLLGLTAVAELLWGWRRLLEVFLAGNAVASCLVYALLRTGIQDKWFPGAVAGVDDVGTSYGAHTVSGAIALSLPVRARRVAVPLALLVVVVPLVGEHTFTDVGHLLSTLVGFLAGYQMRRRPLAGRLRRPAVLRTDQIVTFCFSSVAAAHAGLQAALHLQEHHQVHLRDATVAWPDQASRVHVRETRDMDGVDGALAGGGWGVVAGTLVGFPLAGLALGALVGAVAAHLHDAGLTNAMVRRTVATIPPGGAALLLLIDPVDHPAMTAELVRFGAERLTGTPGRAGG